MLKEHPVYLSEEENARLIANSGVVEIRDLEAGDKPLEYTRDKSGRRDFGPGYIYLDHLTIGNEVIGSRLCKQLALRLQDFSKGFQIMGGIATGGINVATETRRHYKEFKTHLEILRLTTFAQDGCQPILGLQSL